MSINRQFDCIVIGAGHGGAEAANAAAKIGCKTLLLTISINTICKMSCNPAIGGIAKGQIVREIDALGGIMAKAIDQTGIQFRILNQSKGPAVQSPRAQADKYKYVEFMKEYLLNTENLTIFEAMVTELIAENNIIKAVRCADESIFYGETVIVTTGTFLRGIMHIGDERFAGGRLDEPSADSLSQSIERLGIKLERLKTGTPPRLESKTIDYDQLELQPGDDEPVPFSFLNEKINQKQLPCWITWTNQDIHNLLTDCIKSGRAPLYSGQIQSTGARYCPSIETKIMRFADKSRHQVFFEPEDAENTSIYCNGISTSVPRDVQDKMVHLLPGAQNAKIIHYAYAIEYDYCPPVQLTASLETKRIQGLFMAGQVNGTSGYEEAAGQGIIAGINAAMKIAGKEPVVLRRDQAYIGVMIDDLMTRGLDEPYRMFTSRAEYRLLLRSDNADRRLTPIGRMAGTVDNYRWDCFNKKLKDINTLVNFLTQNKQDGITFWDMLRRQDCCFYDDLNFLPEVKAMNFPKSVRETTGIDARYQGYIQRQEKEIRNMLKLENVKLPQIIDYYKVSHLRAEAKEKLSAHRPQTLAQASRISGITPADITVLNIHLKKR
jgi:tRNA uridine 5-carboxymethylaminomethyl modification enzyme